MKLSHDQDQTDDDDALFVVHSQCHIDEGTESRLWSINDGNTKFTGCVLKEADLTRAAISSPIDE